MNRRIIAPALALMLFAHTLTFITVAQQRRRGRVSLGYINARFNQIADAYLRGHYEFNPTQATALGLHEYDARLESRSRDAVAREVRRLRSALTELGHIWEGALTEESRYDYLVLVSHARGRLLELEEIRMWQRDPNLYNRLTASSVDNILKRNYAPIESRLTSVMAREREIPRLLNEARENLQNPPRIYTETAINQVKGSVDYFSRVVPQMVEHAGGGNLNAQRRAEFDASNQNTVAALRSFLDWLERDLLPRSGGSFAIGAENYRKKLLYDEMVDTPLDQLLREGEVELRRTQEEMRAVAEEIAPGKGVVYALRLIGREHPTADGLVGEARAELDRIRAFVRTQNIMTPPGPENLKVTETPEYERSLSFASMDPPGPFERAATEAYYYLTPPDPAWSAQQREEHLSHYNRYTLTITSIHEVYPGHYYQLLDLKKSPSRVRAVLGAGSFVEGWAHYCEQMMLDEGYGGNNPRLRLAQLDAALLRLCRYEVGLRLHTQGMSYEDAVDYFMREGHLERVNAEREARRGTLDPTYIVYTLGKMEIMKLREESHELLGDAFQLNVFHDRLLSYGMPPVKIIRMAMLGNARPAAITADVGAQDQTNMVDFSVLATGAYSSHEGGRSIELVMNNADWESAWRIIGGGRPLPEVNFDTRAVVIAYQGQKPTGGYGISISEIRREGASLLVKISEQNPRPGGMTTQVLTSPFVAVTIPRPAPATTVKFDNEVKKVEQNRDINRRPYRRRGRP